MVNVLGGYEGVDVPICEVCGKPKAYLHNGKLYPSMCDCQIKEHEAAEAAERANALKAARAERVKTAFQFEEMAAQTFEAADGLHGVEQLAKCEKYANRCIEGANYGLLLFGSPDGGKTYASCAIANKVLDAGKSVIMRSVPQLVVFKDTTEKRATERLLGQLLSCDLLILDDLGAERTTPFAQEFVYAVVDGRYNARKPMVVSTNLTRSELVHTPDITQQRIYNRVLEVCYPLEFKTGRKRSTKDRYAAMLEDIERG